MRGRRIKRIQGKPLEVCFYTCRKRKKGEQRTHSDNNSIIEKFMLLNTTSYNVYRLQPKLILYKTGRM